MQTLPQTTIATYHPPLSEPPPLALRDNERWYVVYTHPHRELIAQAQLTNQAFRSFLPRYVKTTRHARRLHQSIAPLFPRYMFVILNLDCDQWHSVGWSLGVTGLIMAGDRPLPVTRGVVEALIASSVDDGALPFREDLKAGQTVRIVTGPFADRLGVLQDLNDHDRVCVLLQMLGGQVPVRLSRNDITLAN